MTQSTKRIIIIWVTIFTIVATFSVYNAYADRGVVVKEHDDKYVIEYNMGYLLVEWYGGYSPTEGDVYVGEFNTFGMKELYCLNMDMETNFWIDDYMASRETAMEFLYD